MNTISRVSEEDIPALVQLLNSAYRGDRSRKGWTTEADLLEGAERIDARNLQKELEEPGATMIKCTGPNDQISGCVYLRKKENRLYLGMLAVSPEIQGGGIGKQLLTAAAAEARKLGCDRIYMTVISVREELIAWYERHGYRKTGETQPFLVPTRFGKPTQPLEFTVLEKMV